MPRRLREDHAGAFYHIASRGVARRTLFDRDDDFRFFLSKLASATREGWLELHAFCLLRNHFHLLTRSRGALSQAMRWVLLAHSKRFNRTRGRDGPLYKARFWSRRLRGSSDFFNVLRYIEHNPVEAGLARHIGDHPFASACHYLEAEGPLWLARSVVEAEVMQRAGKKTYDPASYAWLLDESLSEHVKWSVEQRMKQPLRIRDPIEELSAGTLATAEEWMRETARLADGIPSVPLLAPGPVVAILEHYRAGGDWPVFPGERVQDGWEVLAAGLLRQTCGLTLAEVAARLDSTVATAARRVRQHSRLLGTDRCYARRAAGILHDELTVYRVHISRESG